MAVSVLAGIGFALIVFQHQVRDAEADGAAHLCSLITPTRSARGAPVVRFGPGSTGSFGVVIATDASSVLLAAPLCGLGVILIAPGQRQMRRAGQALIAAPAVMSAWNLLRVGAIAAAVRMGGIATGYQVSNLLLSSVVSAASIALSLALLLCVLRPRADRSGARR
jgi:hypothetical protein